MVCFDYFLFRLFLPRTFLLAMFESRRQFSLEQKKKRYIFLRSHDG